MASPIKIQIIGDAKNFTSELDKVSSQLSAFSASGALTFAGVAGAALAVGTALFKFGESVDDAFDRLQIATGASGEALTGLETIVNDIARTTPASFNDIATAVAGLSQRLDLTGPQLEGLATQVLNLSHITGTDLGSNVETVTALFNNWQVATQDQNDALDELFRASQVSGVSVAELASALTEGGAVLREAGYDFAHATALIAAMGREGINTAQVLTGLRKAEATLAEEVTKSQERQAVASRSAADDVVAAAQRRQDAEERLAQIAKDGAKQAEKAQQALSDATESQADVEKDAAKNVARAKAEAAKLIENVQKPVNDGAVAMADYQKRLADAQEEGAQRVADAEEEAAKRRKDAARRVSDANERVQEVAENTADQTAQVQKRLADETARAHQHGASVAVESSKTIAKAGETTSETLTRYFNLIKDAKDPTQATAYAVELFGAKAGPALSDAIRSGRLNIEQLLAIIQGGSNTINDSAKQTADFAEEWQRFKNNVLIPLEPAALKVFSAITTGLEDVVVYFPIGARAIIGTISDIINEVETGIGQIIGFFERLWDKISEAPGWFGNLIGGFVGNLGSPGGGHAAGGMIMAGGWTTVGERGPENVWLPQGARVTPSWGSSGGGGGDTYNIIGSNVSAPELAREIAWTRRRGDGR